MYYRSCQIKIEHLQSSELLPDQKRLYAAYLAKLREETLKHLDKDTLRKNKIRILAGLTIETNLLSSRFIR